jgi:hypothetical protein
MNPTNYPPIPRASSAEVHLSPTVCQDAGELLRTEPLWSGTEVLRDRDHEHADPIAQCAASHHLSPRLQNTVAKAAPTTSYTLPDLSPAPQSEPRHEGGQQPVTQDLVLLVGAAPHPAAPRLTDPNARDGQSPERLAHDAPRLSRSRPQHGSDRYAKAAPSSRLPNPKHQDQEAQLIYSPDAEAEVRVESTVTSRAALE